MNSDNKTTLYVEKIVLVLLFLTPIFSVGELAQLFSSANGYSQGNLLTPFYIKALKDVLVIIVFILIIRSIIIRQKLNGDMAKSLSLLVFSVAPIFYWSFYSQPLIALAGIRWLMYFALGFLLIGYIRDDLITGIAKVLYYVFIVHFLMQILEMTFGVHIHGNNFLGLPKRNPGIFLIPNTGGFFSIIVMFFAYFYLEDFTKRKIILYLSPISILMTSSATALAVMLVFIVYILTKKRYRKLIPIFFPFLLLLLLPGLAILSGRGDVVESSFGVRIDIFKDLLGTIGLFSSDFGAATQTAVLMSSNAGLEGNTYFTDSTYGAILANVGFLGFTIFLACQLIWCCSVYSLNNNAILMFTLIYSCFGLTTSVTEAFPMNIVFSILIAYYVPSVIGYLRQRLL
jgi:hypothetical protein